MCVEINYLTMHGLPRTPTSIIGQAFYIHACLCDLLPNGGSLTIVDVHGWSWWTVGVCPRLYTAIFLILSMVEGAYKCTYTYTHAHTHAARVRPFLLS